MRLLLVEDDVMVASGIKLGLSNAGYAVDWVGSGERAEEVLRTEVFDAAIIDIGLPHMDGLELTRRLRRPEMASHHTPVLILTARDALHDRVQGLDLGADDYMIKPFELPELLARLRALLRRRPPRGSASFVVGDLSLNPDTHEVRRADREIELTQREFELLEYLMRNERIVVPRQRLLEEVWGYDPFATTNTIEVFVSNLRRKLEAGGEPRLLHTIRGAGYVLRA
jgi:two-component system, OmpR family, response regulator MprA